MPGQAGHHAADAEPPLNIGRLASGTRKRPKTRHPANAVRQGPRATLNLPGNYLHWFARGGVLGGELSRLLDMMREIDQHVLL
ncbi:MAG: putative quorum-sensing-regulated virulence factor [Burkholderiales bacterium]